MASTLSHTPSEAPAGLRVAKKPSLLRRAWRAFTRFLIAFCIGVAATLAWQSHGDAAEQIMASWAAQLGWSEAWRSYGEPAKQIFAKWLSQLGATNRAPDPEIAAKPESPSAVRASGPDAQQPTAQAVVAPTTPAAASIDHQRLEAIAGDLAALREGLEQLITLRQTVDQLTAGQEQMARDIAGLKAAEQDIRQKISAPPPRPAAAPARKPVPAPPSASRGPVR